MSTISIPTSQAEILGRAVAERSAAMSPEAARYFLNLKLAAADERRANALVALARDGELSDSDARELDEYRRCLRFMDLMKLHARHVLKQPN